MKITPALIFLLTGVLHAGTTPELLLKPPADAWPAYHGDFSGQRHSPLKQINTENVKNLGLQWVFQSGQTAPFKCSPILVDGVLYLSIPDHVWAVDARSGHQLWHYAYPENKGFHIGSRGVSMYGEWLYFMSPDGHLVCLNAKDGTVRWNVVVGDSKKGYWTTMSPLIVRNHVIVGVSGDFDNLNGYLKSIDPETGATQWRWDSTPPIGTPHSTTGGMTWMTGTYDPALNMIYWGTGNPTPVLTGTDRPGDNPNTCSIVSINPDTGKMNWAFQASPHDTHDWDAVEIPVLADADFGGKPRKLLMQASRNGYFFVLDRVTGENLLTRPFGPVNWAKGLDAKGRPVADPAKEPAPDGRLIAPNEGGLTNYRSPSFDPKTGLFIVDSKHGWGIYFAKPSDGTFGWAGADYDVYAHSWLEAIDYKTGNIRWKHDMGANSALAGVLTTEGGLTISGDSQGNAIAMQTSDGKTLWHAGEGAVMQSSPIAYELDGRQYVLTSAGSVVFAWALPER